MRFGTWFGGLGLVLLLAGPGPAAGGARIDLGRWRPADLAGLLAAAPAAPGARIAALSRHLLGTPYVPHTLVGGPHTPEQLVVDLAGVDCFTFLDVIEALRRAAGPADFPAQLRQVRYRDGVVAYRHRRHFFSDWVADPGTGLRDVTAAVGGDRARTVVKALNRKADGSRWLPGIPVVRRRLTYLPGNRLDREVLARLQSGDYLGIYSEQAGLDVSHVGLLVVTGDRYLLRHASSRPGLRRVVDVDLRDYLRDRPGLVVYRVGPVGGGAAGERAAGPGAAPGGR